MAGEAAVSSAVQILGNLLVEKVKFLKGVKEEVERLRDELKRMQCFLKDAAEKQVKDERVRNWISDIRDVAHDAEDAIKIFILKVQSSGLLGRCAWFPGHLYDIHRVAKEIKSIQTRLQDIERSRSMYGIQDLGERGDSTRRTENVEWRRLQFLEKDKHVVGLDDDVRQLLQNSILEEKKGLSIAAIVGMGGIGKSTLARKTYNHAAIATRFQCRAWVVVSSEFAAEDIFKQIMLQLQNSEDHRLKTEEAIKKLEESKKDKPSLQQMLQEMLREQLEGKTYFIVLDDVWERAHWERLRSAFPDEQGQTSRLLFTSRNEEITKHHRYIHRMSPLNGSDSWELLLKTAFDNKNDRTCTQELESIGTEILNECHGLPLAITVAGGLLRNEEESSNGWEKVLKQIKNYHLETNEVLPILELSYHNLPPRLKPCFLCLGFFKEDAIIQARTLVHIWVAQGFISLEEVGKEETMEEVAKTYLDELINRNLIQVKDMSIDYRAKTCHVHDLLREVSIRKAKEEIGFKIQTEEPHSSQSSCKARHLAVHCSGERFRFDSLNQDKRLRSLFLHVDADTVSLGTGPDYRKSFEILGILDIEGIKLQRLPRGFRALIGLRCLRMRSWTDDTLRLPKWLHRLKNLEVLDLGDVIVELPNVSLKMDSLRHFYAKYIYGPMKIIENWKKLETLRLISSDNLVRNYPTRMASCRVRKLSIGIGESSITSGLLNSLEKMENLVQLHIRRYREYPQLILPKLSHSTSKREIKPVDPMPVLGKLPKLMCLKLHYVYEGDEMKVLHDGFPSLRFLSLRGMHHLREIHIYGNGMPQLRRRFEIFDCSHLNTDNFPEHIKSVVHRQ